MALYPPYKFARKGVGISEIYCRELGYFKSGMQRTEIDKLSLTNLEFQNNFQCEPMTDSIFQLEYNQDGKVLAAACAKNMYLLFDSSTQKLIESKIDAHTDCCNGVTFIDDNLFATYSDDKTIKVWDLRNRQCSLKTLLGHNSYVKNVEVTGGGKVLITSAYDDPLRVYDLTTPGESLQGSELMAFPKIMRIALAPVSKSFLIITTRGGLIYKLSDMDILKLQEDMSTFNEEVMSTPSFYAINIKRKMLHKDRNKLSFVHVPQNYSDSSMASSVSIHPFECGVLVRHDSHLHFDAKRSWSSVYAFTDAPLKARFNMGRFGLEVEPVRVLPVPGAWTSIPSHGRRNSRRWRHADLDSVNDADNEDSDESEEEEPRGRGREESDSSEEDDSSPGDQVGEPRGEGELLNYYMLSAITHVMCRGKKQPAMMAAFRNILPLLAKKGMNFTQRLKEERGPSKNDQFDCSFHIMEARNRLGLIQGNCFHPSGNFMCSPHENGIRILAFDKYCSSFESVFDSDIYQFESQKLHEVTRIFEHPGNVLTVKCHPQLPQIATGCLRGSVHFHQTQF